MRSSGSSRSPPCRCGGRWKRSAFRTQGLGTIPDTKSYVLEHPAGRDWQYFHNVTLRWVAAIAILGFFAVLVIFYLVRGSVKLGSGFSGRKIVRFNWFERLCTG